MILRRRNKYGAKRCEAYGIKFDSILERNRHLYLMSLEQEGKITELEHHPAVHPIVNGIFICQVEFDHSYRIAGESFKTYEDSKGVDTDVSKIKRKLVLATHGIKVRLIRANQVTQPPWEWNDGR